MRRLSVLPWRARRMQLLLLAGLSVLALTLASGGLAVVHIEGQSRALSNFDARGKVAPGTFLQSSACRSYRSGSGSLS